MDTLVIHKLKSEYIIDKFYAFPLTRFKIRIWDIGNEEYKAIANFKVKLNNETRDFIAYGKDEDKLVTDIMNKVIECLKERFVERVWTMDNPSTIDADDYDEEDVYFLLSEIEMISEREF